MECQTISSEVSCAKITILVGSKAASTLDLEVPSELVRIARESGMFNLRYNLVKYLSLFLRIYVPSACFN